MSCKPFDKFVEEYTRSMGVPLVLNDVLSLVDIISLEDATAAYADHIRNNLTVPQKPILSDISMAELEAVNYSKDFFLRKDKDFICVMKGKLISYHPGKPKFFVDNGDSDESYEISIRPEDLNGIIYKHFGEYASLYNVSLSDAIYFIKKEPMDNDLVNQLKENGRSSVLIDWAKVVDDVYAKSKFEFRKSA